MGNPPRRRKRVEIEPPTLKRGIDGSGFTVCKKCGMDVPIGIANAHDCQLDANIKARLECHYAIDSAGRKSKRLKTTDEIEKQKTPKGAKKPKDPNQPKRPQTAFFVFLKEFRASYKDEKSDSKAGLVPCLGAFAYGIFGVIREGSVKWNSMTDEEKKPYAKRAAELKAEYERAMAKYQEELRQANDEADSAEVGRIDLDAEATAEATSDNDDE
eukprot:Gb_32435 [translate_table: standard]